MIRIAFFSIALLYSAHCYGQVACKEGSVKVGTQCNCHNCSNVINVYDFESYLKRVVAHEWVTNWGNWPNGMNSFNAAAVAIRSYSMNRMAQMHSGDNYDICDNTCCQVFIDQTNTYTDAAVTSTFPYILVDKNGSVMQAEYAAENNDNYPGPPQPQSNKFWGHCGDGHFQKSVSGPTDNGGGCYPQYGLDSVCFNRPYDPSSHPRGMCQRGSIRWASGYTVPTNNSLGNISGYHVKNWQDILAHYYPYWNLSTCQSPTTCQWQQQSSMPNFGVKNALSFSIGQYGYVGGGDLGNSIYSDDLYRYDPLSNSWQQKGNLGGGKRCSGTSFVIAGKAYILTGLSNGPTLSNNEVWRYNPGALFFHWQKVAAFPGAPRYGAIAFSINGLGYAGYGADVFGNVYDDLYQYNPNSDTWIQVYTTTRPPARWDAFTFVIGNKAYMGGGYCSGSSLGCSGIKNDLWEFNGQTWIQRSNLPISVRSAGAFSVNGMGYYGTGENFTEKVFRYSPASNTHSAIASFPPGKRQRTYSFEAGGSGFMGGGIYFFLDQQNQTSTYYWYNDLWKWNCLDNSLKPNYLLSIVGSKLAGARIYKIHSDSLYYISSADVDGNIWFYPNRIELTDTLLITAPNYHSLTIVTDTNDYKVNTALFKTSTSDSTLIMYHSMRILGGAYKSYSTDSIINIEVAGKNQSGYHLIRKTVQNNQIISENIYQGVDDTISVILLPGNNNLELHMWNQYDTAICEANVEYVTLPIDTYNVSISIDSPLLFCDLYIDGQWRNTIGEITLELSFLKGDHLISIEKFGFEPFSYIVDSSLSLAIHASAMLYEDDTRVGNINLIETDTAKYWKGISVFNKSFSSRNLIFSQHFSDYNNLGVSSETRKFSVICNAGQAGLIDLAIVLDQRVTPTKDSVYILLRKNGNWQKEFFNTSNVVKYEEKTQRIDISNLLIKENDTMQFCLAKKKRPIFLLSQLISTEDSVLVLDCYDDPDSIQDDLQCQVINSSFGIHSYFINDSLKIIFDTAFVAGQGYILVGAIHDDISSTDTIFVHRCRDNYSYLYDTICEGDFVLIANGDSIFTSGIYSYLYSSTYCDSTLVYRLTVIPKISDTIFIERCLGDTIYIGQNAITETGTYNFVNPSHVGCDSLTSYKITIRESVLIVIDTFSCTGFIELNGEIYNSDTTISLDLQSNTGCDTIVNYKIEFVYPDTLRMDTALCDNFYVLPSGEVATVSGTYVGNFMSYGCLQAYMYNLELYNGSNVDTQVIHLCEGDSLILNSGQIIQSPGLYIDTLITPLGCQQILYKEIILDSFQIIETDTSICLGESIFFGGRYISIPGLYTDTLSNIDACYTIAKLRLTTLDIKHSLSQKWICLGDSVAFGGRYIYDNGLYYDTISVGPGCDSISTLNLQYYPSTVVDIAQNVDTLSIAQFQSIQWFLNDDTLINETNRNLTVFSFGIYSVTVVDSNGCIGYGEKNVSYNYINYFDTKTLYFIPNPANTLIFFKNLIVGEPYNVEIFSIEGKLLNLTSINDVKSFIDISYLPNGLYNVIVEDGLGNKISRKLMKK